MGANEKSPISIPACEIPKNQRHSDNNCFTKEDFETGEQLRKFKQIEEALDAILDGLKEGDISIEGLLKINSIDDLKKLVIQKEGKDVYTEQINRIPLELKEEFENFLMNFINALKMETDGQEISEVELTGVFGKVFHQIRTDLRMKEATDKKAIPQVF